MRVVFVGAGELTIETALLLIERKEEVVIIEADSERIDQLKDELDCSFLCGDGSKPNVLEEAGPEQTDFLFCLTESDQDNIIAALVGRSLGYSYVVLRIHDEDFLQICQELELEHTITPSKTIGRHLADMVNGIDLMELSAAIKGQARCLTVKIGKEQRGTIEQLNLPQQARVICYYRDDIFTLAEPDSELKIDDEIVILTHEETLDEITTQFSPGKKGS